MSPSLFNTGSINKDLVQTWCTASLSIFFRKELFQKKDMVYRFALCSNVAALYAKCAFGDGLLPYMIQMISSIYTVGNIH
jgi:hypothetical protein